MGVTLVLCLVSVGVWAPAARAEDAFARITGPAGIIQGDQPNIVGIANSANTVQIFSTVFGLSLPVASSPGGAIIGAPKALPVTMVKRFDRASPLLLRAAFLGDPLSIEIIWFMNVSGINRQTVTIKLDNAFITDITASADLQGSAAAGQEQVTVTYSKITFSTPIIDAKGVITGTSKVCLDTTTSKLC
jgi:type VI secretion system Hcp family effector